MAYKTATQDPEFQEWIGGSVVLVDKSYFDDSFDPDAAYERHLEDAGWEEAEKERRFESDLGVLDFQAAWCLADPTHIPASER